MFGHVIHASNYDDGKKKVKCCVVSIFRSSCWLPGVSECVCDDDGDDGGDDEGRMSTMSTGTTPQEGGRRGEGGSTGRTSRHDEI